MRWHILTGEYPPSAGGVGDYTALLAAALADAGDSVDVWVGAPVDTVLSGPVRVHALPDAFGTQSRKVLREAWDQAPGTVLLQYVPNALGHRGMNIGFCRWLLAERHRERDVRVMFHEPYFYFTFHRPWRNAAAVVQRGMAALLLRAAEQRYYSSANWHAYLRPYGAGARATVLPIPATIPCDPPAERVRALRVEFARGGAPIVGHFGTFGRHIAGELLTTVPALLHADVTVRVILIGRGGDRFKRELLRRIPGAAERVHATGEIPGGDVAAAMSACDVLLQPYPDGVTTRRTSVMAGLRNAIATVSSDGPLTENVWRDTGAVALAPREAGADGLVAHIRRLLGDPVARTALALRGRETYVRCFSMDLTVRTLREPAPVPVAV